MVTKRTALRSTDFVLLAIDHQWNHQTIDGYRIPDFIEIGIVHRPRISEENPASIVSEENPACGSDFGRFLPQLVPAKYVARGVRRCQRASCFGKGKS